MSAETDQDLAQRVVDGDRAAFELLVARYRRLAGAVCLRLCPSKEDAADALQETFMKAFRSIAQYRRESKFSSWLVRIATNTCLDLRRKRQVRSEVSLDELQAVPETADAVDALTGAEGMDRVRGLFGELPDEFKAVLYLKVAHGMRSKEIAESLGVSINVVRNRIHRARNYIRMKLGKGD